MIRCISVVFCLVFASTAIAAGLPEFESLLETAGSEAQLGDTAEAALARREALLAARQMTSLMDQADAPLADEMAIRLHGALHDASLYRRALAARLLAARPTSADMQRILAAWLNETESTAHRLMLSALVRGVRRLPDPERLGWAEDLAPLFEAQLRNPITEPELRTALVGALGDLGEPGLFVLRGLAADPDWADVVRAALPGALGQTGEASAGLDLLTLYEVNESTGYRISLIEAMGAILRSAPPEHGADLEPVVQFLRALVVSSPDELLAASAARAYCKWSEASSDFEVVDAIQQQLLVSHGDERKACLQALYILGGELRQDAQGYLEGLAASDQLPTAHRKIAEAILVNAGQ